MLHNSIRMMYIYFPKGWLNRHATFRTLTNLVGYNIVFIDNNLDVQ